MESQLALKRCGSLIGARQALCAGIDDESEVENLDAIVKSRHARADRIINLLRIGSDDVVLDLGSGLGFVAEKIAPRCSYLHCADISPLFLKDCRKRLSSFKNVEFHLISYADLSPLLGKGISRVYSTLLFIHFNFYDFTLYLRELHRLLTPGGLLFFDFNDGDRFLYGNQEDSFNKHSKYTPRTRLSWIFECMHMFSLTVLRNVVDQIGFDILQINPSRTAFTEIVLRKRA